MGWRVPFQESVGPSRHKHPGVFGASPAGGMQPLVKLLQGHSAGVQSLDSQGLFVVSASDDGTARLWDLQACSEVISIGHPAGVRRTLFFPESTLLASACIDGATRIWDLRANPRRPS